MDADSTSEIAVQNKNPQRHRTLLENIDFINQLSTIMGLLLGVAGVVLGLYSIVIAYQLSANSDKTAQAYQARAEENFRRLSELQTQLSSTAELIQERTSSIQKTTSTIEVTQTTMMQDLVKHAISGPQIMSPEIGSAVKLILDERLSAFSDQLKLQNAMTDEQLTSLNILIEKARSEPTTTEDAQQLRTAVLRDYFVERIIGNPRNMNGNREIFWDMFQRYIQFDPSQSLFNETSLAQALIATGKVRIGHDNAGGPPVIFYFPFLRYSSWVHDKSFPVYADDWNYLGEQDKQMLTQLAEQKLIALPLTDRNNSSFNAEFVNPK